MATPAHVLEKHKIPLRRKARYFIAKDGAFLWYIVDARFKGQWKAWRALPAMLQDQTPTFARKISSPECVTFGEPRIVKG